MVAVKKTRGNGDRGPPSPTKKKLCDCSDTCLSIIGPRSIKRHKQKGFSYFFRLFLWGLTKLFDSPC